MSEQYKYLKVAFLDTNTLHYIGLYLCHSKHYQLYPWSAEDGTKDIETARVDVSKISENKLKQSLKRGLETVQLLLTKNLQVQYSPVSELELLTGKTRGKAILYAAKEGVPDRMWTRFYENEIRSRLDLADMAVIKETIRRLSFTLEESGVAVKANIQERMQDALGLAKDINGLVYMEPMDSIIYANAIIAGADFLVTSDESLRKTINHIYEASGESHYEQINKKLKRRVSAVLLGDPDDGDLPCAFTVTPSGTVRPDWCLAGASGPS